MTVKELNRDIKRLINQEKKNPYQNNNEAFKKEFLRLYWADQGFTSINLNNLKGMLRINLIYRFVGLHQFGLHIEL